MKDEEFLKKFTNRIEQMGKDGIVGILKNTREPINNLSKKLNFNINSNKNNYQKNYLDYNRNLPKLYQPNSYLELENEISNYNKKNNVYHNKPFYNPFSDNYERRKLLMNEDSNNLYYSNQVTNKYLNIRNKIDDTKELENKKYNNVLSKSLNLYSNKKYNNNNIIDYGYIPYTLKSYKKLPQIKLGKLGRDFNNEEWKNKKIKMKKMVDYGKEVLNNEMNSVNIKKLKNKNKKVKNKIKNDIELKNDDGKWNKKIQYNKSLSNRIISNSNKYFQELSDEIIKEREKIEKEENHKIYLKRLEKMKNLFLK